MLSRFISQYITYQIDRGILKAEDRDAYEYGYYLMALEILNISVMALIGILFHCLLPLFCFTLCLISLRKYSGGIHASDSVRCAAASACLELAIAWMIHTGLWQSWYPTILLAEIPAVLIIWSRCPIPSVNKPLTPDEVLQFRRKCRLVLCLECVAGGMLALLGLRLPAFLVVLALLTTAGSMLLCSLPFQISREH